MGGGYMPHIENRQNIVYIILLCNITNFLFITEQFPDLFMSLKLSAGLFIVPRECWGDVQVSCDQLKGKGEVPFILTFAHK